MLYHRINEVLWLSLPKDADDPSIRNVYQNRLRSFYKALKHHPNDWKKALNHRDILGSLLFLSAEMGNAVTLTAITQEGHSFCINYNDLIKLLKLFNEHQIGTTECTLSVEDEDKVRNQYCTLFMDSMSLLIGMMGDRYCNGVKPDDKTCLADYLTMFLQFMLVACLGSREEQENTLLPDGFTREDVQRYFDATDMSKKHKRLVKEEWTYLFRTHRPMHYLLDALKAVGCQLILQINGEDHQIT